MTDLRLLFETSPFNPVATLLANAASTDTGDQSALGVIGDWAVEIMNLLGAIGVGLLVLIENIFPPIPSEVILPLAGFAAADANATFTVTQAIIWATVGSILGAYILYGLGAWLGHDRTVKILVALPFVERDEVDATINWFNKYGYWTVFFGRMVPIFRSLISLPAGIERMSWWKFGIFTALGSAIWNTIFVTGGYLLGENWHIMEEAAGWLQYLVIALVLIAIIAYTIHKIRKAIRNRRNEETDAKTDSVEASTVAYEDSEQDPRASN